MTAYAELAVTTNFSFLRGASHPQEMVARAKELGLTAIGVADRNTLAGVVRAHAEAKEQGIQLLVGARLVTTEGFEVLAYPMDRAAYGRLCKLLSAGKLRAPKGECHIGLDEVLDAENGQILIALPPGRLTPDFAEHLARLAEAAPHRTYLALAHRHRGDERRRFGRLAELALQARAPLVAVADALYHVPERRPLQDVLTCIREKCTIAEAGFRLEANAERHLRSGAEMARLFAGSSHPLARTVEIAEACKEFSLTLLKYEYPEEPVPPGYTAQDYLTELTWKHARWKFGAHVPDDVAKMIEKELDLIAELKYAHYFLTIYDTVSFARDKGILCQGRGSAANSVLCYVLGITAVDPTKVKLLFARFISKERREPPDIDVDFEHERREEVIQHLYERYTRERAAICATVIHYRPRMAIREVGKVLGLTPDVTAAIADTVWGSWGDGLPDAHVRQAGLDPENHGIRQAIDLAHELIGFPRHLSQHVGGFVLTQMNLDETVPVGNAAMKDRTFIEWDKDDIDVVGLIKVDVLALGMLTTLRRGLAFLRDHYGKPYHLIDDIPPEQEAVYDMLCKADSVGVFQVESRAQMSMLPRLKPREFYDLVVEVAIVRPGPIQGDMVHPYLRRRELAQPIEYPAPDPRFGPKDELEEVLRRTYGVPLFQEQAMRIAMIAAGFTDDEADGLRRAMATFKHVGKIHEFEEKFVGGMTRRGYPQDFAARCFKQIKGFSTYGFPESHAASFALLVYASAWIKCHHPDVFLAAILNSQPMGFYQPAQLVRDAREHGVEVRPPDVNASAWDCTLEPALEPTETLRFAVRLGLRQIKGLGKAEVEPLLAARGNGFHTLERMSLVPGVPRRTLERLAEADALRSLGLDRRGALWVIRGLDDVAVRRDGSARTHAAPLLASALDDDLFREPAVALKPMPLAQQVAEDYNFTSLSLKAHPVAFFRERLRRLGCIRTVEHRGDDWPQDARVSVAGLVLTRQRPGTAKGVMFLTLEDESGIANVIVWPKLFEARRHLAMNAAFLVVRGRVQRAGAVVHVLAEDFLDLTPELRRLRETIKLPRDRSDVYGPPDSRLVKSRDFH